VKRACAALAIAAAAWAAPAVAAVGCGGEPPRAPTLMRPIDEGHALQIIARVMRAQSVDVERNRVIHVGDQSKELRLDAAAKGQKWGIAYITNQDGATLLDVLPRRRDPDAFIVLRGNGEGEEDTRAVLLFAGDYMQDDLSGEAHTATTIAAEEKLSNAVKYILRKATDEKWP
jgi:hypothetical protein